jgi:hypothetical protein
VEKKMKILLGLSILVLMGVPAAAQTPRVVAEIAASSDRTVKNSPFSAEAVSESVQVLADGNRIVRSSTSKLYRNSEGRFRRELSGGTGGALGAFYTTGSGITILDPVQGQRFMIDSELRTARVAELRAGRSVAIAAPPVAMSAEDREKLERAYSAAVKAGEVRIAAVPAPPRSPDAPPVPPIASVPAAPAPPDVPFGVVFNSKKYESQTEQLGTRDFEGVSAEGQLTRTTIPAGAIGNERPIEITYEKWYSKDLEMVVYSKQSDPRFGEQTYRLTNIVRAEPDASLFTLPQGYKILSEPGTVYRIKSEQKSPGVTVVTGSATAPKP